MFRERKPPTKADQYPLLEGREAIHNHATRTRMQPEAWLARVEAHVKNGDISINDLEYFVSNFANVGNGVTEFAKRFPNAKDLYTYLKRAPLTAATHSCHVGSRGRKAMWPACFSLAGAEMSRDDLAVPFSTVDLLEADIPFLISQDGITVDLTKGRGEGSHTHWESGKSQVEVCDEAERRFFRTLTGKTADGSRDPLNILESGKDLEGIVFLDQGKAVGLMKFIGSFSLLALRSVGSDKGTEFHKGMLYALDGPLKMLLRDAIRNHQTIEPDTTKPLKRRFLSVDIAALQQAAKEANVVLGKTSTRFLGIRHMKEPKESTVNMYEEMDSFAHEFEAGAFASESLFPAEEK